MLVLVALLVTAAPSAATPAQLIAHGEKLLGDLEYGLAAEELMRAATAADATPEERLKAHLLAGIANRITGHDVDAQLDFRYVLTHAPETQLPEGTSPKVVIFFEAVRQDLASENARRAPAPAAPVVAPAPAPAPAAGIPFGLVVAGGGAMLAAAGGAGLLGSEVFLEDPTKDGDTRATVQTLGVVAAAAFGVGVVAAAVGAALTLGS